MTVLCLQTVKRMKASSLLQLFAPLPLWLDQKAPGQQSTAGAMLLLLSDKVVP